jgi:hypothetical protein
MFGVRSIAENQNGAVKTGLLGSLPFGRHLLSHVEKELRILLIHSTQKPTEPIENSRIFARMTPGCVVLGLAPCETRDLGRLLAVVEELIERDFECPGELLDGLDGRDGMAVLDTRYIAAEQTSAFLDVSLRQLLFFTENTQAITDYHV